ncbi:Activator of 90 kDa heat shock protein ATPase-like protein [Diplonema papillatum]|nr:Activator of 90 kDa heat shock protein ATPase-like protein [Diplonema papillatum]
MAEIGKGDQRWIVSERQDGANVNNWHWTERDILDWARSEIVGILKDNIVEKTKKIELKITDVKDIEGDCLLMNRKKKLICTFDLKMDVHWEGRVLDEDTGEEIYKVKGKMVVPDVDDTTIGDSMNIDVTCAEEGDAASMILDVVRTSGRKFVRKGLEEFAETLKDTHNVTNKTKGAVVDVKSPNSTPAPSKTSTTDTSTTDHLNWRIEWRCPPSELWDVLTNQAKACAYTRSQVQLDAHKGGAFSYLGGSISGTFVAVDAPKGFHMKWRLDNWALDHFSDVEISLDSQEAGVTEMIMSQKGIPYGEKDRVREGWIRNFWDPIKTLFGFIYTVK